MIIRLKRMFFKLLGKTPATEEMVKYWKHGEAVQAKVTEKDGVTIMYMEGEKYAFPGFPRGYLLYGKLSKLKHEVKNQVFNQSWSLLEEGTNEDVQRYVRSEALPNIYYLFEESHKLDLVPPSKMVPAVSELHRAWTKHATTNGSLVLRDIVCHIFQEDDSYRFRFQWMTPFMGIYRYLHPVEALKRGLEAMEHAEMIGDMKERVRLVRRIMLVLLEDKGNRAFFNKLFREIKWRKIRMTKADKYFFGGKYFKVDWDRYDY